jgi:hypothetical protein
MVVSPPWTESSCDLVIHRPGPWIFLLKTILRNPRKCQNHRKALDFFNKLRNSSYLFQISPWTLPYLVFNLIFLHKGPRFFFANVVIFQILVLYIPHLQTITFSCFLKTFKLLFPLQHTGLSTSSIIFTNQILRKVFIILITKRMYEVTITQRINVI